jgi:hypothetical protein
LVLSFSLTPYLWKEKLLKTPPDGDVPSWNMGSIILIERRPLAFLSTKAWTGPSRHYTVSLLHCRRRGTRCMTPPGRIVSTFSINVRSSDHSHAGVRLNIVHLAHFFRVAHGVGSFWVSITLSAFLVWYTLSPKHLSVKNSVNGPNLHLSSMLRADFFCTGSSRIGD